MTWEQALNRARLRASETHSRWYVRGYQRTISHVGEWLYGAYPEWNPQLNRANRPHQWWADNNPETRPQWT